MFCICKLYLYSKHFLLKPFKGCPICQGNCCFTHGLYSSHSANVLKNKNKPGWQQNILITFLICYFRNILAQSNTGTICCASVRLGTYFNSLRIFYTFLDKKHLSILYFKINMKLESSYSKGIEEVVQSTECYTEGCCLSIFLMHIVLTIPCLIPLKIQMGRTKRFNVELE